MHLEVPKNDINACEYDSSIYTDYDEMNDCNKNIVDEVIKRHSLWEHIASEV